MSIRGKRDYLSGLGGSFTEDAPRPPVPGEEGELVCSEERQCSNLSFSSRNETLKCDASVATPRRPDLDLGYEPEGSASPTPPFLKWAESLHSLLDDQDGIHLFRMFLKQEDCTDMLDFWFACSGFRKLEANESNDEKKGKLAKAIYKKFILDTNGIVSRQIKPATKSFIRDSLMKLTIDPAMFDQAQTEIQTIMEDNTYPLFLKSDIYLEYTQTGGESPKPLSDQSSVSGDGKELSGYLPTLNEDEEWRCEHESEEQLKDDPTAGNQLTQRFLMETAPQSITGGTRDRHAPCRETLTPYHVNTGYTIAVPTSTNDSEQQSMSSDADTVSLTDSSLDGMPPCTQRKQHRREMQESAKANGRLPLPHIPRTSRIPKDIHVEPERFAAQLISRLEAVQLEREAQDKLEERLKRVRLEENGEEATTSTATGLSGHRFPSAVYPQNYNSRCADITHTIALLRDAHDENPESILDDHVQRVMKTPGCLSPRAGWRSPRSCSPDRFPAGKATGPGKYLSSSQGKHPSRHPGLKGESSHHHQHKHVHHIHHAGSGKPREQAETEATVRVQSRSSADGMGSNPLEHPSIKGKREYRKFESARPYDTTGNGEEVEKNQKILLWLMEGEKEMVQHKKSPYGSTTGSKRITGHESFRHSSVDRCGSVYPCVSSTQLRNDVQPSHPFIQDPTMPPNPAPSPLIQLEEVCRRLEEQTMKSRVLQTKQKYVMEVIQRGRSAARPKVFPPLNVVPAVSDSELSEPEHKGTKKPPCENTVVAYYFCEEQIPYRTSVKERVVTLGQFKELLTKKGNYRYYFKKVSDEFDCGVVFEEVREDDATLPIFDEKIVGKVEKIE